MSNVHCIAYIYKRIGEKSAPIFESFLNIHVKEPTCLRTTHDHCELNEWDMGQMKSVNLLPEVVNIEWVTCSMNWKAWLWFWKDSFSLFGTGLQLMLNVFPGISPDTQDKILKLFIYFKPVLFPSLFEDCLWPRTSWQHGVAITSCFIFHFIYFFAQNTLVTLGSL